MKRECRYVCAFTLLSLFICLQTTQAQWQTQVVEIKAGWNAVYLHVDPSHQIIGTWIGSDAGNPITQVWRWTPPSTTQFASSPSEPVDHVSGWTSWVRNRPASALVRMYGNTAFLVESTSDYTWNIKGRPVAPLRSWNIEGLNLVGFSTVPGNPPNFSQFLAEAPELQSAQVDIFEYRGPSLQVNNPVKIAPSLFRNTPVKRGKAYWIRSGTVFNKYFGPFEVALAGSGGVTFYDNLSTYSLRLRNLSPNPVTVSMTLKPSESAPNGQVPISGVPPLLVRGPLDLATQRYGFSTLPVGAGNGQSFSLAPRNAQGSEIEVVLGLDRAAITASVGSLLGGILSFKDSFDHTEINLPVSGKVASDSGLWVGDAMVTQVEQYLKSYERGAVVPIVTDLGGNVVTNDLMITTNGQYVVESINTDMTPVPKPFPLRLIMHKPDVGFARLLQRVYYGMGMSTVVLSRVEEVLDPTQLDSARRISATHLPWTEENEGWSLFGSLAQGSTVFSFLQTKFDDQVANPFLHRYHPDHDNVDARFQNVLTQGSESYTISRLIFLDVDALGTNFLSRVSGGQTLTGTYRETISVQGLARAGGTHDSRRFEVEGVFQLNRISSIAELTDSP
jgi:hypothetical protein